VSKIKYPELLSDKKGLLDDYIFDYFNAAYPDEVAALIEEWKKKYAKKPAEPTPKGEHE
jgi:hypothetical protein